MDRTKDIVRQVIASYAGPAVNGQTYLTVSADEIMYTVVGLGKINGEHFVTVGLVVRLLGNLIVIERDVNDKLLVDALVQAGIPRSQIVLAYAGEAVEEPA
jgi:hypothetical protein